MSPATGASWARPDGGSSTDTMWSGSPSGSVSFASAWSVIGVSSFVEAWSLPGAGAAASTIDDEPSIRATRDAEIVAGRQRIASLLNVAHPAGGAVHEP